MLLKNTLAGLATCNVTENQIEVFWVPGAFEIPVVAKHLGTGGLFDVVICLGVILKGETDHDRILAVSVSQGILGAARETGIPMVYGVLSADTVAQVLDRLSGESGDRGRQFALTAVEMANLVRHLRERGGMWHRLFSKT